MGKISLCDMATVASPFEFSAGIISAFAIGDLGEITLFADAEKATLPLKIYQLMGPYRMEQAASGAVLFLIPSLGLLLGFDKCGRRNAAY